MNKILLFLALIIACVLALKPSLKNALRDQVITDFKNAIVPIISKKVEHITVPDIHTSSSGFHIDVTNIVIQIQPINPAQIAITLVAGTSAIKFTSRGFSMKGSGHVHVKWAFISKSMGADVGLSGAGFDCQISLYSNGGKPNIKVDSLSVHPGSVSIHLHGDIIVKIIGFIVDLMKGHITKEVVNSLQGQLPGVITKEINDKLNKIPTDIDITPAMSVKYGFPYAPFVNHGYIFTGINAHVHPKNNPNPPPYEPANMPEFDANNAKGIQFFLADYVVRSSADTCYAIGLLAIHFEKDMLGHHISMDCKATQSPSFAFHNAIDVVVGAACTVIFDKVATNKFTLVAEVHVNLQEYIRAAVIYFSISIAKFNKLEYKQENPVDIEWFKNGVNDVLEAIKEFVNGIMGSKGIPLPTIPGIDYTDTVQYVKDGYIEICMNPVFHFT